MINKERIHGREKSTMASGVCFCHESGAGKKQAGSDILTHSPMQRKYAAKREHGHSARKQERKQNGIDTATET